MFEKKYLQLYCKGKVFWNNWWVLELFEPMGVVGVCQYENFRCRTRFFRSIVLSIKFHLTSMTKPKLNVCLHLCLLFPSYNFSFRHYAITLIFQYINRLSGPYFMFVVKSYANAFNISKRNNIIYFLRDRIQSSSFIHIELKFEYFTK